MSSFPCLVRSGSSSGQVRYVLGERLVDRYLEFVGGRARPNTLRAVAFDLKAFFNVVPVDPVEVTAADVFEFLAHQRGDRSVARLADRESGLSARTIARRLSSVSGLYSYLVARGDTPVRVNPVPRGLSTPRRPLSSLAISQTLPYASSASAREPAFRAARQLAGAGRRSQNRRSRPRAHYSMGWLALAARLASCAPGLVNAVTQAPLLRDVVTTADGIDRRRRVPLFGRHTFQVWSAARPAQPGPAGSRGAGSCCGPTPSPTTSPRRLGRRATEVLKTAGYEVTRAAVPRPDLDLERPAGHRGQGAGRTVRALAPYLREGLPVVGLEPSCTAVFRSDAASSCPATKTSSGCGSRPLPWPSCSATTPTAGDGLAADLRPGHRPDPLPPACDHGMEGRPGVEAGHYDVSLACGERALLPAVRDAAAETLVLADGFSCRTQIGQASTGRAPVNLAEVLAAGLRHEPVAPVRPAAPTRHDYARLAGLAVAGAAAAGALVISRPRGTDDAWIRHPCLTVSRWIAFRWAR